MVKNKDITFACRVCGLNQGEYPWGEDNESPTFGICDCCGTEFGYEDCTIKGIIAQRNRWLSNSGEWWNPKAMPLNWSLEEQLKNIPSKYK